MQKVHKEIESVLAKKRAQRHTGGLMIITRVQMQNGGVQTVKTETAEIIK